MTLLTALSCSHQHRLSACNVDKFRNDWFEVAAVSVAVLGVGGGLFALYLLASQI